MIILRTFLLLWSFVILLKADIPVEDIARIILDTTNVFSARCVYLIDKDSTMESRHQVVTIQKLLAESSLKIRSTFENDVVLFNSSSEIYCSQNRPLVVLLLSNDTTTFMKFKELPTYPRWLVFVPELRVQLRDLLRDIFVPFDSELLVASCAAKEVHLAEFYSVSPGEPLRLAIFGIWEQRSGLRILHPTFLYARRRDLHGIVLKAAVMRMGPAVRFFGDIWKMLEILCNFTTEYSTPPVSESQFGVRLSNGSWTGGIGMVADGKTDFAVSDLTLTKDRAEVVGYLNTLIRTGTQLLIREPHSRRLEWTNFLAPFSPYLWSAILMTVILLAVTLSCVRIVGRHNGNAEADSLDENHFTNSLWVVLGLFCQQGHETTPSAASSRVTFLVASAASVIVLASYSASLISTLTNQKFDLPFTNLEGLADDTRYKVAFVDKILISTLLGDNQKTFKKLKNRLYSEFPPQDRICTELVAYVAMPQSATAAAFGGLPCKTVWLEGNILMQHRSIVVSKENHYKGLLNYYLARLRDAGIIKQRYISTWPRPINRSVSDAALVFVDLAQILPALATLTAGLLLGALLLLVECLRDQQPTQGQHIV